MAAVKEIGETKTQSSSSADRSARSGQTSTQPNVARSAVQTVSNRTTRTDDTRSENPDVRGEGVDLTSEATALATSEGVGSVLRDILGERTAASSKQDGSRTAATADGASQYRSSTPVPLEGYDAGKLNDPNHNTPKYIFGRVAQGFKLDSVRGDKANAEALLNAMLPDLRAAGLEVVAVKGDRIQVKTEVGYEWVDVIRGAGGNDPGWWWGSEGKGTPNPTATPQEWAAATGVGQEGGAGAGHAGGAAPAGGAGHAGGAAPAGGAPPNPNAGVLGSQIDQGKVMAILEKHPPTNEGIRAAMPELQKEFPGVNILEHPQRLDKLQFSNGAIVDVIVAAGGPNPKWGWMPEN